MSRQRCITHTESGMTRLNNNCYFPGCPRVKAYGKYDPECKSTYRGKLMWCPSHKLDDDVDLRALYKNGRRKEEGEETNDGGQQHGVGGA